MIRRTLLVCFYLTIVFRFYSAHAESNSPSLRLIYGEDSSLDPSDRDLAPEVWQMVELFLSNSPSFARQPQMLTVVFARSDGAPVREVFGRSIQGTSAEEYDGDGHHRIYLAWDRILENFDSPLLATFELIANKLYRIGFALEQASENVVTERIRGLTGTLMALNELRDSDLFPELPDFTQNEIKLHAVAHTDRAYHLYNSTEFADRSCARALMTELFRHARQ